MILLKNEYFWFDEIFRTLLKFFYQTILLICSCLLMQEKLQSQEMKIMTYNIKYQNETDGENSWSKRKDHLTNQIRFYEPGILGVQEAVKEQLEHLKKNLEGYEYLGKGRDGGILGEFTAIFFDTQQFEKLEEGTFWLSETPEKPSIGWDAAYPRACTYAEFKEKESGTKFWVFNTHFDHQGMQARDKSSQMIIEKMKEINKQNLPAILMGDFNLEPNSEPMQFLKDQLKDSKDVAKVVFGPEGTFNAYEFQKPVKGRIDYIFLNNSSMEVEKYAVLSDSKDMRYPSDHFPVVLMVKFLKD